MPQTTTQRTAKHRQRNKERVERYERVLREIARVYPMHSQAGMWAHDALNPIEK